MTQDDYINPIDQLVHCTLRIECETSSGTNSGTGFFVSFFSNGKSNIPCIVTNKHVICDAKKGQFHLTQKTGDGTADLGNHFLVVYDNFESKWIGHPDPNIDLAIFPIAPILQNAKEQGINIHYTSIDKKFIADKELLKTLSTMEDIIMIGYPNGIWDEKHNLPIIRKGITATHPRLPYNNKPEFMIDAACFPGSSGSPVFLANIGSFVDSTGALCGGIRIALLGVLYAGPQHTATGEVRFVDVPTDTKPVFNIPNNLGLVIHGEKINDFEPILKQLSEQALATTA